MRISLHTLVIAICLLFTAAAVGQEVEGRLIELNALEELLAQPGVENDELVVVLLPLAKADVVQASSSVERTFAGKERPRFQPASTSKAVFISGTPILVGEAVRRLKALDEITPEPKPRTRVRPQPNDGSILNSNKIQDFQPDVDSISNGISALAVGLLMLGIFAVVLLRRMFR